MYALGPNRELGENDLSYHMTTLTSLSVIALLKRHQTRLYRIAIRTSMTAAFVG